MDPEPHGRVAADLLLQDRHQLLRYLEQIPFLIPGFFRIQRRIDFGTAAAVRVVMHKNRQDRTAEGAAEYGRPAGRNDFFPEQVNGHACIIGILIKKDAQKMLNQIL